MERVLRIAMCIVVACWIMNNLRLTFRYFEERDGLLQKEYGPDEDIYEEYNILCTIFYSDMIHSTVYYVLYIVMYQLVLALMKIGGLIK